MVFVWVTKKANAFSPGIVAAFLLACISLLRYKKKVQEKDFFKTEISALIKYKHSIVFITVST